MNQKIESTRAGSFVVSEGNGKISRESIDVAAGPALLAGQLLGVISTEGVYAPYNNAATNGTEIAIGALYAPLEGSDEARPGVAVVRLAELDSELLIGLDAAAVADLKTRHIILR